MSNKEPQDFEALWEVMKDELKGEDNKGINPERWHRIHEGAVLFADIVEELTGLRGSMISCPFHGKDTNPSFAVYPPARGNCGYCFGCSKMYSPFKFVQEYRGVSARKALRWIEKVFQLPPLDDVDIEKEDASTVVIVFEDLVEPYISFVKNDIREEKDACLAEEYLDVFFKAEVNKEPLPLAHVLGRETLTSILLKKEKYVQRNPSA